MNATDYVQELLRRASHSTDGILAPITSLVTDLRARQAKCYEYAACIERQIIELNARYNSTRDEGDRAGRVAIKLEEIIL